MIRSKVLPRSSESLPREMTDHTRRTERALRQVPQVSGVTRAATVPPGRAVPVLHGLGRLPKGVQVQSGDNGSCTVGSYTKESVTVTNSGTSAASVSLWIY
jgi:hypothetical protein